MAIKVAVASQFRKASLKFTLSIMQGLQVLILLAVCAAAVNAQGCSCEGQLTTSGTYRVSWKVRANNRTLVDFNVSVDTAMDTWAAVGFSVNNIMPMTDVAIGADNGNESFVEDRWNGANRNAGPTYDAMQDLTDTSTTRYESTLTISFTRSIISGDNTQDTNLDKCRYVLWAWGGRVGTFPSMMDEPAGLSRHTMRGVFDNQLCLCAANETCPSVTPPTTASATTVSSVVISILVFLIIAVVFL